MRSREARRGAKQRGRSVGFDYSFLHDIPGAIPKGRPKILDADFKRQEHERLLQAAYDLVDARDGTICRVTGRQLVKGIPGSVPSANDKTWLTRHHLKPRSTNPAELYNPAFIFVCSWLSHKYLQKHAIEIEGTDARKRLFFRWNPRMFAEGEKVPFRIVTADRSSRRGLK